MRGFVLVLALALMGCDSITPLGDQALARGDVKTAVGYYSSAGRQGEPGAWAKAGALYDRQGKFSEAAEAYRQGAIAGDPLAIEALRKRNTAIPPVAVPQPATAAAVASSPEYLAEAERLARAGYCSQARSILLQNQKDHGGLTTNLGWVYLHCDKDPKEAIPYLQVGARYGDEVARRALRDIGQPIPAPDLVGRAAPSVPQTSSSGDALTNALGALLGGYVAGRYAPAPTTAPSAAPSPSFTTCDARRTTMGANIGMDQRYSVNCY